MKEQITIITVSTEHLLGKKVCEIIKNEKYTSYNELREFLNTFLEIDDEDDNQPQFFSLSDFINECNEGYLNLDTVCISYVYVGIN